MIAVSARLKEMMRATLAGAFILLESLVLLAVMLAVPYLLLFWEAFGNTTYAEDYSVLRWWQVDVGDSPDSVRAVLGPPLKVSHWEDGHIRYCYADRIENWNYYVRDVIFDAKTMRVVDMDRHLYWD
jgi:hypothetical protein